MRKWDGGGTLPFETCIILALLALLAILATIAMLVILVMLVILAILAMLVKLAILGQYRLECVPYLPYLLTYVLTVRKVFRSIAQRIESAVALTLAARGELYLSK